MKKIFLILTVLVSFNAFSIPKMTDIRSCMANYNNDPYRCVNRNFRDGYEIIGTTRWSDNQTISIHMAKIEK